MKYFLALFLGCSLYGSQVCAQGTSTDETLSFEKHLSDEPKMVIRKINAKALRVLQESESAKIHLLDAREQSEYAIAHIQRAKSTGFDDFNLQRLWMVDKKACVVVYSANEKRAVSLSKYLRTVGYMDVQVLEGGLINWVNEGNSILDENNVATNRIHTGCKENAKLLKRGKATWQ
jgi:rhodanese-related sulfurtransferase